MAHTAPDWTSRWKKDTVHVNLDLSEHAARTGSINTFDRRGTTVWMDDFEGGTLKFNATTGGTGAACALDTARMRNGSKSCKLTTGDAAEDVTSIERYLPFLDAGKFGLEAHITHNEDIDRHRITIAAYDGTNLIYGAIEYDESDAALNYLNSGGTWSAFKSSFSLHATPYLFHAWKLVIDTDNEKYVRFIIDNTEHDISAYALRKVASATDKHIMILIEAVSAGANEATYVDDVIFTQEEP